MTSFILHIQYIFKAEKNSSLYKHNRKINWVLIVIQQLNYLLMDVKYH